MKKNIILLLMLVFSFLSIPLITPISACIALDWPPPLKLTDQQCRIRLDYGKIIVGPDGTIIEVGKLKREILLAADNSIEEPDEHIKDSIIYYEYYLAWDANDPNANTCPRIKHKRWGNPQLQLAALD